MATITVEPRTPPRYRVTVDEGSSQSVHEVTVPPHYLAQHAAGADPVRVLELSFEFLLEREPKEAILGRFDLPVIERYFPDYPAWLRTRLG